MRGVRDHLGGDVADFGELVHEVHAVVKAAGGVNQHNVRPAGDGCFDGVIRYRCWVCAGGLLDDIGPRPFCPNYQLVHGGGAEGIGRTNHHLLALLAQHGGQFADGCGLTHAVYAHHQHHVWLLAEVERLDGLIGPHEVGDFIADYGGEFLHVHVLVLLYPVLYVIYKLEGCIYPHVRA